MTIKSSMTLKRIQTGKLAFEFLESGDIFRIAYDNNQINLLRGNLIDGQAANIYLRKKEHQGYQYQPLLGVNSNAKVAFTNNQVIYQGSAFGVSYQVVLTVYSDRYYYDVLLEKHAGEFDVVYGQDLGIASVWSVLSSEAYTAQYIDHAIYQDQLGYIIQSRQNQGDPQFFQLGSLNKTVGYATDGFQVFKQSYKLSHVAEGLLKDLENKKYQYEFPYLTLQSESFTLNEDKVLTFYGYYEPWHEKVEHNKVELTHTHKPVSTYLQVESTSIKHPKIEVLNGKKLSNHEIETRYEVLNHLEKDDNHITAFFTKNHVHVVTLEKELMVERPHGHLLLSGELLSGSEKNFASTNWMFGVFASHIVLGNTNIQKLNNDLRNPLNLQKISGLRIYIKKDDAYHLLGVPSLYEMGLNYTRWIYVLEHDEITVTAFVGLNAFAQEITISSKQGHPYDIVITNQLAMGDNEYQRDVETKVDDTLIELTFETNDFVKSKYPKLSYYIKSQEKVTYSDDRVLFGKPSGHGLLLMTYDKVSHASFTISGSFDGYKEIKLDFDKAQHEYLSFIESLTGLTFKHPKYQEELNQLTNLTSWYTYQALIHFASPHGLEQSNGAAWGTRDVSQGPVELFLSAQRFDLIRMILLKVFSRQFIENKEFPQWFMFDEYYTIQAHESHGDVIAWPIKVLGDYLEATKDYGILKEKVPFMSKEKNTWVRHDATLYDHLVETLNAIEDSFIEGTSLPAYGGGDWDDTLQPANKKLTDHMVSGWTPLLIYQGLKTLSQELTKDPIYTRLVNMQENLLRDYHRLLVRDNIPAGFIIVEENGVEYLLHPQDKNTGLKYRLLPLTRGIISEAFSQPIAENNKRLIDQYLKHPDGVRLMDTAVTYRGGEKTYFQRAETAANFGREIGILYVHAHIRYIEAMAKLGYKDEAYQGLFTISPIDIKSHVKNALPRQSNMYFSSSDANFYDRYEAKKNFDLVRNGAIGVKGGWRLYSSGPGIYINQLVRNVLGIKIKHNHLVLDPVLPQKLDGLQITYHYQQKPLRITYRFGKEDYVKVNGDKIQAIHIHEKYRKGGYIIDHKHLDPLKEIDIEISIK